MKYTILIIISIILLGCSQKYYKNNIEISKNEYSFYKNRCDKNFQEYSYKYDSEALYSIGQKRYYDEYIRECIEVINRISLEKKDNNYQFNKKKSSEINIFKLENNLLKISK